MPLLLPSDVKRDVLIKDEEPTDPSYGCPPEKRSVQELLDAGIINLDKPPGGIS